MAKVEFVKEPGYAYDLFRLFALNFNTELMCYDEYRISKTDSATAEITKILAEFGPFSNDLLPFFYVKDGNVSFMSLYYFDFGHAANKLDGSYSWTTTLEALSDFEKVITNAFHYYFEKLTEAEIAECRRSPLALHRMIKDSPYTSEVKSSLYSLFWEPEVIIQKLMDELMEKEKLLSRYYQDSSKKLSALQKNFNLEEVLTNLEQISPKSNFHVYKQVQVSFSLFAWKLIYMRHHDEKLQLTFGSEYNISFRELLGDRRMPELHVVGNALAEPNRIDILNLMLKKEEVAIRDIEQELGFSGTNAFYHLKLMTKANIVKSRSSGRPVYYSINRRGFDEICKQLLKYTTSKDELSSKES